MKISATMETVTCSPGNPLKVHVINVDQRYSTIRFDIDGKFVQAGRMSRKGMDFEWNPEGYGNHKLIIRAADTDPEGTVNIDQAELSFKSLGALKVNDPVHERQNIPCGCCGRFQEGRGPVLRTEKLATPIIDGEDLPPKKMHIIAKDAWWLTPGRHEIVLRTAREEWVGWFVLGVPDAQQTDSRDVDDENRIKDYVEGAKKPYRQKKAAR